LNAPRGPEPVPVNLGQSQGIQAWRALAEKIFQLTDTRSRVEFRPLPVDDPKQRQPDITVARKAPDWSPKIELDGGFERRRIAYFRELFGKRLT